MKKKSKTGVAPGTLIYRGKEHAKDKPVRITLMQYDEDTVLEKEFTDVSACLDVMKDGKVKWINVDGIHRSEIIEKVGEHFKIHPLTMEDIVNTDQRPKFEDYETYLLAVLKMVHYDTKLHSEQLAILLFDQCVISFQEADGGDAFDFVRQRIRQGKGKIRKESADYLAYSLLDAVVDTYFNILEKIGDQIETLEEHLIRNPKRTALHQLYILKREMIYLRKAVWPMRELLNNIERSESPLIKKSTDLYVRDLYDHTIRVIDTVETYRDLLSGMMDIYLSSVSNKMNEVMKVLTIISTIFIPVTFIAGVYGMNFKFMPEIYSPYGYWITWGVMLTIMISLLIYFRVKKWL